MYGKIFSLFLSFFKNAQIELLLLLLLYCACFNWNGNTTYGIRALQHPIPISLQWSAWVMMVPVTEKLPFICLTTSAEKKTFDDQVLHNLLVTRPGTQWNEYFRKNINLDFSSNGYKMYRRAGTFQISGLKPCQPFKTFFSPIRKVSSPVFSGILYYSVYT